jgi:hypothetical protein
MRYRRLFILLRDQGDRFDAKKNCAPAVASAELARLTKRSQFAVPRGVDFDSPHAQSSSGASGEDSFCR